MGRINSRNDGHGLVPSSITLDKRQRQFLAQHGEIMFEASPCTGGYAIIIAKEEVADQLVLGRREICSHTFLDGVCENCGEQEPEVTEDEIHTDLL